MLYTLLLLALSPTTSVEQAVQHALAADSLAARQTMLVPFREEIDRAAAKYTLPSSLIAGVIQEESRFDEWATRSEPGYLANKRIRHEAIRWARVHPGSATALTELNDRSRSYGLMQIMGETARQQGCSMRFLAELYMPDSAIDHGARLLKRLILRYHGDTLSAISAYNQGSARKRRGTFANARYVYRVTVAWRAYDTLFRKGDE